MRRGVTNRFSPAKRRIIKQSGMDGNGDDVVFSEKSKKKRVRRLNVVGRVGLSIENCEMGYVGSDGEDELHPTTSISKRFKLPGKFFDDCNTVNHSSVPRKLRSAMKKRNHESISPPLPDKKKPKNHGAIEVELPRKESRKKFKSNQQYSEGSPNQIIEGPITQDEEEVVETLNSLAAMFPFPNDNKTNDLDCELANTKSLPLPEGEESSRPEFEDSTVSGKEEDPKSPFPSATAESTNPSLSEGSALETVQAKCFNDPSKKSEPVDVKPSCSSVSCNDQSILSLGTSSSKQPKHEEATAYAGKPKIDELGMAASATQLGSMDSVVLTDKDSIAPVGRKSSWKRCSAHVYISCLIKVLQIAERREDNRSPVQPTKFTPNDECSKQGVVLPSNDLNMVRSALNCSVSLHSRIGSSAEKNPNEVCFEFLSLSAGGGGLEATDQVENLPEPPTQFRIPYLHSFKQNHTLLPFSLPQIHYSSTPFTDNLPVAAAKQVQTPPPPHYLGTPLQDQWTTQVAAQYKSPGVAATHIPNLQNGRQDPSSIQYHPQSFLQPSPSSLQALGPNYAPILQQPAHCCYFSFARSED